MAGDSLDAAVAEAVGGVLDLANGWRVDDDDFPSIVLQGANEQSLLLARVLALARG